MPIAVLKISGMDKIGQLCDDPFETSINRVHLPLANHASPVFNLYKISLQKRQRHSSLIMGKEEEERPILIALKGHPGTGKSTLAEAIAKNLKCPLIDKDHFRDSTRPIEQALMPISPTTAPKLLNDLSYDAMLRVISTQLSLGLSVVVDSPLSRRIHLDRLLELVHKSGARIVVVECRPGNVSEWRRRLEERGETDRSGWHKPSTWRDMERLFESYSGCWDYDVGEVPKLVLDTTGYARVDELVDKVIEFVNIL